jgi:RNA polymerase sigma-70 factor, ECF subfamily
MEDRVSEHSGVMALPIAEVEAHESPAARVGRMYRRYHPLVYRLALRYGRGDAAWAEDITQEVFLRLFDVVHRLVEGDGLEGWFYRVTTNRCLNRLRRERLRNATPLRWLLGGPTPEPVDPERLTAAKQGLHQAWDALESLAPKERIAFCMHHLDGRHLDEIGAVLGHSKGYVCKLVQRAQARIRMQGWEVGDV